MLDYIYSLSHQRITSHDVNPHFCQTILEYENAFGWYALSISCYIIHKFYFHSTEYLNKINLNKHIINSYLLCKEQNLIDVRLLVNSALCNSCGNSILHHLHIHQIFTRVSNLWAFRTLKRV